MRRVTRQQAVKRGLTKYFTSKACRRGHIDERWISNDTCISCAREAQAARFKKNPEQVRERDRKRYRKNPESKKKANARWHNKNKDYLREYYSQWHVDNLDHIKKYSEQYYRRNTDKIKKYAVRWIEENPERRKEIAIKNLAKRRAIIAKTQFELIRDIDLNEILKSQKHRCPYCRADLRKVKKHQDHIYPLNPRSGYKQGTHSKNNIQFTCETCNLRKNNQDPKIFAKEFRI